MTNITRSILISMFTAALTLGGSTVSSASTMSFSGAQFPHAIQVEDTSFKLRGVGVKKLFFLKAFVAGLYLGEGVDSVKPVGEVPKRVEVKYFTDIPAKKLNSFTVKTMLNNISQEEFANIQSEVELMKEYFLDLTTGDSYALTYVPGVGTIFEHNDRYIGTIEGEDFAKALFAVWVGERPFDEGIKEQMLNSEKQIKEELARMDN